MENIRISVITVTLNAARGISDTLRSVADQTYPNVEHIVKDGGSSDDTIAHVLSRDHARLRTICKPDAGIYDAMNQGIEACSGDLVLFLNAADVLLSPTGLADFIDSAYRDTQRLYLFGVATKDRGTRWPQTHWPRKHYMLPAPHQGMIYPADLLKSNPFSTEYRIAGDYEHFLRIQSTVPLANTGILLTQFDDGGISTTNRRLLNTEYHAIFRQHRVHPMFRLIRRAHELHDYLRRRAGWKRASN